MAILDTSFLINFMHNETRAVALFEKLERLEPEFYITAPTATELWRGTIKAKRQEEEQKKVQELFRTILFLPFDLTAAKRAAELEAVLEKEGISLTIMDLMIASIALVRDDIVVTNDADFTRVPGLQVLKY